MFTVNNEQEFTHSLSFNVTLSQLHRPVTYSDVLTVYADKTDRLIYGNFAYLDYRDFSHCFISTNCYTVTVMRYVTSGKKVFVASCT